MKDLIRITEQAIGNEPVNSVDARELHSGLRSKRQFANWIKTKVIDNPFFEENVDYCLLNKSVKAQPRTSQPLSANRKDYALTMDTAKKVSMAEQTTMGNDVRDYFLECEKTSKAPKDLSKLDILKLAMESEEARIASEVQRELLQVENQKLSPKAASFDTFLSTTGTGNFTETAKILGLKPRYFTNKLQKDKILYHIGKALVPYQTYLDRRYFEMVKVSDRNDKKKNRSQARVTSKGLAWLRKKYLPEIGFSNSQDLLEIASKPKEMTYNTCQTCGANNGRAGILICRSGSDISECLNCSDTRKTGNMCLRADLSRTDEEVARMVKVLLPDENKGETK